MLTLRCTRLRHYLCDWLINYFDPLNCVLRWGEKVLSITKNDVGLIFGVQSYGQGVDLGRVRGDDEEVRNWSTQVLRVPMLRACEELLLTTNDRDDWKKLFMLYLMGTIIAHSSRPEMLYLDRVVIDECMLPRIFPRITRWDDKTISKRLDCEADFGGYGLGKVVDVIDPLTTECFNNSFASNLDLPAMVCNRNFSG
ncbi:hypothetical protein REPUB_Repub06bG0128700 [Reevesia pubescens]